MGRGIDNIARIRGIASTAFVACALGACQSVGPVTSVGPATSDRPAVSDPSDEVHLSEGIKAELDAAIHDQLRARNLPSVAVSISVPGEDGYDRVVGTADLATGRARELADPFRIASNTKTFVGLAILQLEDEGRLATTDAISTWFPGFPDAETITVENLLRMRSGIPDPYDAEWLQRYYDDPLLEQTAADTIDLGAARMDGSQPPDTETRYTNVNFVMLASIVEMTTGQPIQTAIDELIVQPLGLTGTVYPTGTELPGDLHGYGWDATTGAFDDKTILNPEAPGGAGAMISTIADLKTYVRALCTGQLLQPETHAHQLDSQALAGAPPFVSYGEGIGIFGPMCGHTGTIMGFSTDMFYLSAIDATLIVSVNRLDVDDQSQSTPLTLALTKIAFPDLVEW